MDPLIGDILRAHGCPVDPVPVKTGDQADALRRQVSAAAARGPRRVCLWCAKRGQPADLGPAPAGCAADTPGVCQRHLALQSAGAWLRQEAEAKYLRRPKGRDADATRQCNEILAAAREIEAL
ncbi:MAG: hypothetical protein A2Y38_24600 [Spirochaetes bacterium GWB1_59_5]|nr:MAG: hypothetical protein A2Y38_24600 [Spirochaetes bacterium GWB1_59_5]